MTTLEASRDFAHDTDAGDREPDPFADSDGTDTTEPTEEEAAELGVAIDFDSETATYFDRVTGEVLSVEGAPEGESLLDAHAVAAWLGPQLADADARLAGLLAERDAHLKRIAELYDGRIQRAANRAKWFRANPAFTEPLRRFAQVAILGKRVRSTQIGLLTVGFKRRTGRLEITDKDRAAEWAERHCPEALKVVKSCLVSRIPDAVREAFRESEMIYPVEEAGIVWEPAFDVFEVK